MELTPEEFDKFKEVAELYQIIKPIIIYSEEIDKTSNYNIQIIKELRDAFDHVIRVITVKTGIKSNNKTDYIMLNIEKCIGHVYRAGFDALDGLVISLKEDILSMFNGYKSDIITSVIPDYWKYRQEIIGISKEVSSCRENKDSGNNLKAVLSKYLKNTERLKEIHSCFTDSMPLIEEKHKETRNNKILSNIIKFSGWIIATVIGISSLR